MAPFSPLKMPQALCTTMAQRHHCLASSRLSLQASVRFW